VRPARAPVAALAIAALGLALLALDLPLCPVAGVIGIPCPGCGLGRATLALARGEVAHALALHPLVLVVLPTLGLGVLRVARSRRGRITAREGTWVMVLATVLLVALIGVWAARFFGAFGGPVPVAGPIWQAP
jgi:hypothetical protein